MREVRVFTAAAALLALACVAGAVSAPVGAWLDHAMGWVLAVGVGAPAVAWVAREAWEELQLARELARARPRSAAPGREATAR